MPTYAFTDPAWINEEQTRLNCFLWSEEEEAYQPYTLDLEDADMTVDNEVLLAQILEAGELEPFIPEVITQEDIEDEASAELRARRKLVLLGVVDPFVTNPLRWQSLTEAEHAEVNSFRDALLNISEQEGWPLDITWPETPWCIHPLNIG